MSADTRGPRPGKGARTPVGVHPCSPAVASPVRWLCLAWCGATGRLARLAHRGGRAPTALFLLSSIALAGEPTVVERYVVYSNRVRKGLYFGAWSMEHKEREGRIFLNGDCKAKPWAGIIFKAKVEKKAWLTLTDDWVAFGHVRFRINGLADPYGNHGAPCQFQVRLFGVGDRYLRIRGRFYEGQEGIDADPDTWQEVHVPLKYLGAKPGEKVTALALQCVGKPVRAFAIDGLSLVRFSGPRETTGRGTEISVAQPWVSWPAYEDLPADLKLEAIYPRYRGGAFVTADGRRTFLITQWGREDQLGALGVSRKDGSKVSHYGLYDPETQGFIYEQALNGRSMARLGFNCYAGQVHPVPFWRAVGYPGTYSGGFGEAEFREHVGDMRLPFYVDMVCFPWTLGKPGVDKKTNLSAEARHDGDLHWTPFRIIGRGRDVWLTMWRAYAERYKAAGADVLFYELMNEPAYQATTADHRDEFVGWLKERYGGLADLNAAWATVYRSWDEIRNFKGLRENAGIFFDYDEYLADRFADLVAAGQEALDEITPGVPAAVQSMGGYCLRPRDAIFHHKLIPRSRAVLTPTGGGRWSRHLGNNAPKADTIDYGMSGSPVANDLLLAMAGNKMIVDNEMYLGPRQTRVAVRNRWWQSVIVGMDGASWFSWSKRGWAWWKGRENIRREADLFPYSALIPYARRADAIRGTLEFAREMMLVRDYVLPKPWGPRARVGMLYSWATARWRVWDPSLRDKSGDYHAAMKYLHWNFDVIPSHMAAPARLRAYGLLVAGGIDHVEPGLVEGLTEYVRGGGALVVGEGAMSADLYGKPTGAERLLGVRVGGHTETTGLLRRPPRGGGNVVDPTSPRTVGLPDVELIPGEIRASAGASEVELLPGTETLSTDADGRPMVTRRDLGRGRAYYIAADLIGYPLSKLLASIRAQCGPRPALEITDGTTGQLAPNILLSRRSYEGHHALILMNRDAFPKLVRIRIMDLKGDWYVSDPLSGRRFTPGIGGARWTSSQIAAEGILYAIAAENRAVLLLTRRPWTGSVLSDVNGAAARSAFETELKAWKDGRKKEDAPFAVDPSRVIYVDLKGVANATKDDVVRDAPDRWLGFPFTEPLVRTFAGVPFQIIRWDHNAMKGYVALKSAATPGHPAAVRRIRLRARARRIFFLHAAGEGRDGETLGTYTVRYVDGSTADIPIVVGRTIARLRDRVRGGGEMATGLVTGAGSAWHVTQWRNPEPGKAMASLDVTASPEASGTIVLVALTVQR